MEKVLPIIMVLVGFGIPMYFTGKNAKPTNVFRRIIKSLQENPLDLWYHYFTKKGMEKWLECEDLKVGEIRDIDILDYKYENYTGKLKAKLILVEKELIYYFHLVKNPDFRAKSRWVISDLYKER